MPTLVLLRHGQSAWNLENRFTGWWDVDVTEKGAAEARAAGELMAAKGLDFDMTFTSLQTRAIKTLNIALEAMGRLWLPVEKLAQPQADALHFVPLPAELVQQVEAYWAAQLK